MSLLDDFAAEPFKEGNTNSIGFALRPDQEAWRRRATEVATSVLAPQAAQVDAGVFPSDGLRGLWESGLLHMTAPIALGGGGADLLSEVLVTETLAQHCGSTAMCFHMHASALQLISRIAGREPASDGLRDIVAGYHLCTYATSEAGSGSHWWHMDQAAERHGDGYRISATKSWATSAGHADYYVVPLRANTHADPNELTLFLVPGRAPGVRAIGSWDGSGMRGNSSTPVQFELTVANSARLGPSGHGFQLLFAYGLPAFQLGLAAVYLGIGQAAYDAAALHAVRRVYADTGQPKGHSEITQQDIAEMKLKLDTARSLLYVVAGCASDRERQGADPVDLAGDTDFIIAIAQTKVAACEAATGVTDAALRVCGGSAYKRGHVVERCYRDARAGSVMGPDDDSLKILIGKRLLGVPFPWSIRDS